MFSWNLDEEQILYEIRELKDKYPYVSIEKAIKKTRNNDPDVEKMMLPLKEEDSTTLTFKFSR